MHAAASFFCSTNPSIQTPHLQERGASVVESVIITYKNPECGGTVVLGSQNQETWTDPLLDTKGES